MLLCFEKETLPIQNEALEAIGVSGEPDGVTTATKPSIHCFRHKIYQKGKSHFVNKLFMKNSFALYLKEEEKI